MSFEAWRDMSRHVRENALLDHISPPQLASFGERDAPILAPLAPSTHFSRASHSNLSRQLIGFASALTLHSVAIGLMFWGWQDWRSPALQAPSPPMVVELLPLPSTPSEPRRVVAKVRSAAPGHVESAPIPDPIILPTQLVPTVSVPVSLAPPTAKPLSVDIVTASPPPVPPRQGEVTFEGMLLARIEQFRRYPADAARQGKQGVVQLRFRMDRRGRVLKAEIAHSSGIAMLDTEALRTLHRAEPLPEIPADRPEVLDVSVPVEFMLRSLSGQLAHTD